MIDFNTLDDAGKRALHERMIQAANALGGKNHFYQLLEAIRESKPHPLVAKHCKFHYAQGVVQWNKVIFDDKLQLLLKVRPYDHDKGNLLPAPEEKGYKNVLNLVRTLRPIVFTFTPANSEDGEGFTLSPIEVIDAETSRLDPLFDAIFFVAIPTIKKILNYLPAA